MTWLRFALLAVDRTVGGIIFLLQKMEPPIRNKPPIRNTFAADRVIFRIGVFTVFGATLPRSPNRLLPLGDLGRAAPNPIIYLQLSNRRMRSEIGPE